MSDEIEWQFKLECSNCQSIFNTLVKVSDLNPPQLPYPFAKMPSPIASIFLALLVSDVAFLALRTPGADASVQGATQKLKEKIDSLAPTPTPLAVRAGAALGQAKDFISEAASNAAEGWQQRAKD